MFDSGRSNRLAWLVWFLAAAGLAIGGIGIVKACECNSQGSQCMVCTIWGDVLGSQNKASSSSSSTSAGNDTSSDAVLFPTLSYDQPRHVGNRYEILLVIGRLNACFKSDSNVADGSYTCTHPDVTCTMTYKSNPGTGEYSYTIKNNGYVVGWNSSRQLVCCKGPGGVDLLADIQNGSNGVTSYTQGGTNYGVTYDGSGRPLLVTQTSNPTVRKTYLKYIEDNGALVRKRVTVEEYNSDGTKRFLTTIYAYYGPDEGYKSGNLKFTVSPEGVRRCLSAHPAVAGVDPDDPGETSGEDVCGLDSLTTAPDGDLDDYASAIYSDYDAQGRVTRQSGPGAGCGSCGGAGGGASTVGIWYLDNGGNDPANPNSWKTCRRTCLLDSSGNPLAEGATVEYLNAWDQAIFSMRQTVAAGSGTMTVANVWITHNVYEVNSASYGDGISRLKEVRNPSACAGYTVNKATATIGTVSYEWATVPTVADTSSGLVNLYEYYISESSSDYTTPWADGGGSGTVTYTSGTAKSGSFKGQLAYEKVRQGTGSGGTAYYLRKYTYIQTSYLSSASYHSYQETAYSSYATSDTGGDTTTNHYQFFKATGTDDATHAVQMQKVVYPTVSTDQHGSGSATAAWYSYKQDTTNNLYYVKWTKQEDGALSYTKLNSNGTVDRVITDANTNVVNDDLPSTWSSSSGLHLVTIYGYDLYGRVLTITDPAGQKTQYAYMSTYDAGRSAGTTTRLVTLSTPFIDSAGHYDYVPMSVNVTDLDGRTVISAQGKSTTCQDGDLTNDWTASWTEGTTTILDAFAGTLTARADYVYDDTNHDGTTDTNDNGWLTEVRRYHHIPASGDSSLGTNYHRTVYQYDGNTGHQVYTIQVTSGTATNNSVELVRKTDYDQLGRATQTWQGVSDASHDMTASYDTYPTLYRVSANYYDESTVGSGTSGVGDGLVTSTRQFYGSADTAAVRAEYYYDYRGRLRGTAVAGYDGSNWTKTGPFVVTDYDNQDRAIATASYDTQPTWTGQQGVVSVVDYAAMTATNRKALDTSSYDPKGQVFQAQAHAVNVSTGSDDGNMATRYWYDAVGRTIKVKGSDPDPANGVKGAFAKTAYDGAGRAIAEYLCFDHNESDTDYSAAGNITANDKVLRMTATVFDAAGRAVQVKRGTSTANAVVVEKRWYDAQWNGGTQVRPYLTGVSTLQANLAATPSGDSNYVITKYEYDSAGRVNKVTHPAPAGGSGNYVEYTYDDLGRPTKATAKNSSGSLLAWRTRAYGADGQSLYVTSSRVYSIPTGLSGDPTVYLETAYDHDGYGRLRRMTQPSGAFTKTLYDDYGRFTGACLCIDEGSTVNPLDLTDDTVVEQAAPSYDIYGRVWMSKSYQRNAAASGTGALTSANARITHQVTWWDALGRTKWVADYGTNGGTEITAQSADFDGGGHNYAAASMTTGTAIYLLTYYQYDCFSRDYMVTDNRGLVARSFFDQAGRITHVVENYVAATCGDPSSPGSRNADVNRVTRYVYNEADQVAQMIAVDPDHNGNNADSQVTRYVYAAEVTDQSFQVVPDGTRLRAVIYPDSDDTVAGSPANLDNGTDSTYDRIEITYFADGSVQTRKDQRGTAHTCVYDDLGRRTKDRVTALGGVDDYVQSLTYAYDDLGRLTEVKSWSGTNGDGTCRNAVQWTYETSTNGWGTPTKCSQEHNGQVGGQTPYIGYSWGDGVSGNAAKYVRLESVTYANGRVAYYNYVSGTSEAALVRVDNIAGSGGATQHFVEYSYLGAGTVVGLTYPNVTGSPSLQYTPSTDWDRFGRVLNHRWVQGQTVLDRFTYGYDAGSNRLYRKNEVNGNFSELYHANNASSGSEYDGLNRLVEFHRGTLAGDCGSVSSNDCGAQQYLLDQLGNWTEFKSSATSGPTWNLDQTRTHDKANELTNFSGGSWPDPNYDAAGNMTAGPKGDSPTTKVHYKWDAWNRVVGVYNDDGNGGEGTAIALYYYDGRNFRIAKAVASGSNWDRTDYYYNESWQVLEERKNVGQATPTALATLAKYQYVWDIRYIDSPVLRDEDTNGDGDCCDTGGSQRLYYLNDASFNVTALIDTGGTVQERYAYDPYGKVTVYDASWTNVVPWANSKKNAVLFCGYRYDSETGLYPIRMELLHPCLGRWNGRDPSLLFSNLYEYSHSAPSIYTDPSGKNPILIVFVIVALLATQTEVAWAPSGNETPQYKASVEAENTANCVNGFVSTVTLPIGIWGFNIGSKFVSTYTTNVFARMAGGAIVAGATHKASTDILTGRVGDYLDNPKEHLAEFGLEAVTWFIGGILSGPGPAVSPKEPRCYRLSVNNSPGHTSVTVERLANPLVDPLSNEYHFRPATGTPRLSGKPVSGEGKINILPAGASEATDTTSFLITETEAKRFYSFMQSHQNRTVNYLRYSTPFGSPFGENCTTMQCRAMNYAGVGNSGLLTGPYGPGPGVGKAVTGGTGFKANVIRAAPTGLYGLTLPAPAGGTRDPNMPFMLDILRPQPAISVEFTITRSK